MNRFSLLIVCTVCYLACTPAAPEQVLAPCLECPECPPVSKTPVNEEVVDSRASFEEAISGLEIPAHIVRQLTLLEVCYRGYDSLLHRGQLLCHREVAGDLSLLFNQLLQDSFPIEKVVPVSVYGWDDERSMQDNNTSCFNYRPIPGSSIPSQHAFGFAIDINPRNNPQYSERHQTVRPSNGNYDTLHPGTIHSGSPIVKRFRDAGWWWGGNWPYNKDYQHFSKRGN